MHPPEAVRPPVSQPGPPLSNAELWGLAERICASPHFNRSSRLRELLRFLCRRAWDNGVEEIKEHEIGVAVFERGPQFDSSHDTLVRVQASQLRKRLERYFAEEGADERYVLEIPRGSYAPIVSPRGGVGLAAETIAVPARSPSRPWIIPLLATLCLVLAATCVWLILRPVRPPASDPSVQLFWNTFAANGRENYVVLADSAIAAVQDALRRPIGLDEYVRRSYEKDLDRQPVSPEYRNLVRYLMARRYTSLADVLVVRQIAQSRLLDPARTAVVYARDHNVRAFQAGNNILIGSQRAIPWVHLFDERMDFHISDRPADFNLEQDAASSRRRVENRRPKPGEPAVFESDPPGPEGSEGFSLIAYLPNLSGTGNTLILAGTDMSGTEAAGTLLTTESFLADLLGRLPRGPTGAIPHFEVLLKTRQVENTNHGFRIAALHVH